MLTISQNKNVNLIQDKKSVDWLVNNTTVSVFDPVEFNGYQRQIDEKHCDRIIKYLEKEFILPTSIICATDTKYKENNSLRIVDGQHRIQAFRIIKKNNTSRYNQIKNYEIPIIVMENIDEKIEIETFITINKTSKKVDTSLAYVLKNKLNNDIKSDDLSISKRDYLSVELARMLNIKEDKTNIWKDKILFEGNPRKTNQLISLNAFVKSTRSLLLSLENKKIIDLKWNSKDEVDECLNQICEIVEFIWKQVYIKWKDLFTENKQKLDILQGAIGYTSINKFLIYKIKNYKHEINIDNFKDICKIWIFDIKVEHLSWEPGEEFSKYTSESGYNIVAKYLIGKE